MQHVVTAFELPRGLDADDVVRLFHHAHDFGVAIAIAAILADLAIGDVVADAAQAELVLYVEDGLREMLGILAFGAQYVKRDALRGFLADAGEPFEFRDQPRERFGEIRHRLEQAGGKPMPPSMPPIFCWICASTCLTASPHAATIMS